MKKQNPITIKELKEHAVKIEPEEKHNMPKLPKKKKLDFEAIALIIGLALCIVFIFIMACLFTSCTSKAEPDIQKYAQEQADDNWFDYSYEIIENYDEDNVKRYHITYYYQYGGKIEYIVTYDAETNTFKKELIDSK